MSPLERIRDRLVRPTGLHVTGLPVLEDVVLTLLSAVIVIVLGTVVFIPPRHAFEITVEEAMAAAHSKQIEIYGRLLDENGQPLKNQVVELFAASGARVGFGRTKSDGSYVIQWNGPTGTYRVLMTVVLPSGGVVTGSTVLECQMGHTYGVYGTLTQTGTILFAPIPGY